MNNKETLQSYNNRLNDNNASLNGILDIINELPETSGEVNLQDKEVTPTKETQVINYDEEYDGLNQVTVKPIPSEYIIPNGTLEITQNGEKDVTEYSSVNVNVPSNKPILQDKTVKITENGTTNIVADEGYDGLNNVEVTTNVGSSGGKYAPRFVSFRNYDGTDLNEELANLDTSKVTSMYGMFNSCANFTELDLGSLDTSKVTNMYAMFGGCKSLVDLDLSNFDTSNVTNMGYMFSGCSKLENLDIRNFDFSNVTNYTNMFGNVGNYVPIYCVIIVKDDTAKEWVYAVRNFPNIRTVAELG